MKSYSFKRKKFESESKIQTEKEKLEEERLRLEIEKLKRPWYKNISVWLAFTPVIIAILVAYTGVKTGYFNNLKLEHDIEGKILEYQRDTLKTYIKNQLSQVDSIKFERKHIQTKIDSLIQVDQNISKLNAELQRTELSKQELFDSVSNVIRKIESLIDSDSQIQDSLNNVRSKEEQSLAMTTDQASMDKYDSITDKYISQEEDFTRKLLLYYNSNVKFKAIIYRQRLIDLIAKSNFKDKEDLKNKYSKFSHVSYMYELPTNILGLKAIVDDLSYLLSKAKGIKL